MNEEEKLIQDLKDEIKYLRKLLDDNNIKYDYKKYIEIKDNENAIVKLSKDEKIAIYKDYFRGRNDIVAARWESNGKNGYSPICENHFINGLCDLKKYPGCKNCPNKSYAKLNDGLIIDHIMGRITLGIYPMLDSDECYFIAIDFDENNFKEEALSFKNECLKVGIQCLIEKSRSGNGAHVWIFLEDKYPALKIRKIASYLLTKALNNTGIIKFSSYDRMFPSQDKLLRNGIGNLIALPLQGNSGRLGNTLFVDGDFNKLDNQFLVIKNTKKVEIPLLDSLYKKSLKEDEDNEFGDKLKKIKLSSKDFKEKVIIFTNGDLKITKNGMSTKALKYLMRIGSFLNRKYFEKQAKRISVYNEPKIITLYKEDSEYLYLPRGCFEQVEKLFKSIEIDYQIINQLYSGLDIDVSFNGELRDVQQEAFNEIINHKNGIIVAPTGFGKTVLACKLISHYKKNTLILVNTKKLCDQWKERLEEYISFNSEVKEKYSFGRIHSTKKEISNRIDIALVQTLVSNKDYNELFQNYGLVIFDESHHSGAVSYESVLRKFNSNLLFGFTATPKRSDGFEKIEYLSIGPIIYQYINNNSSYKRLLYPKFTKFKLTKEDSSLSFTEIETKLIEDEERNNLIVEDILNQLSLNKKILVLTSRIRQAEILEQKLKEYYENIFVIHGQTNKKIVKEYEDKMKELTDEEFVLISTGQYIGEGFDDDRLDTLFITTPFKWSGTLTQYVGRLHREREGKESVQVFDYVDINVSMISKMFSERLREYKKENYVVIDSNEQETIMYSEENYCDELIKDLQTAEQKIYFFIQYANSDKLEILINNCNVSPIIYSQMKELNIEHNDTEVSYNLIIIDNSIVWYGGINPFIFKKEDYSIMRISDEVIAINLLKDLEKDKK